MAGTMQATWRVRGRLHLGARDALAGCLEASFTDEPVRRPTLEVAPGVTVVVDPDAEGFTILASVRPAEPPTDLGWLDAWVRRSLELCGLADAGPMHLTRA